MMMLDFFFGFLGIAIIYVLIYFVIKKISSQHYWYDTFVASFIFGVLMFLLDNIYSNGRKVFLDNAYYQKTGLHFPDGYYYIDNDLLWVGILLFPIILIESYIRSQRDGHSINKRIFLIAPFLGVLFNITALVIIYLSSDHAGVADLAVVGLSVLLFFYGVFLFTFSAARYFIEKFRKSKSHMTQ